MSMKPQEHSVLHIILIEKEFSIPDEVNLQMVAKGLQVSLNAARSLPQASTPKLSCYCFSESEITSASLFASSKCYKSILANSENLYTRHD